MVTYLKRGKSSQIRADEDSKVREKVEAMIKDIEAHGDEAVRQYSKTFDN